MRHQQHSSLTRQRHRLQQQRRGFVQQQRHLAVATDAILYTDLCQIEAAVHMQV
jgi:ElaB/YqjD/DUF883 family membrane-anchored ribosome-binding protein